MYIFINIKKNIIYFMYMINLLLTIGFDNQNQNQNIFGTAYRSDMFLSAKRKGGPIIYAHIKHITVALLRKIGVTFFVYTLKKAARNAVSQWGVKVYNYIYNMFYLTELNGGLMEV